MVLHGLEGPARQAAAAAEVGGDAGALGEAGAGRAAAEERGCTGAGAGGGSEESAGAAFDKGAGAACDKGAGAACNKDAGATAGGDGAWMLADRRQTLDGTHEAWREVVGCKVRQTVACRGVQLLGGAQLLGGTAGNRGGGCPAGVCGCWGVANTCGACCGACATT